MSSRILTTTLGAFPKPDYLRVSDWFTRNDSGDYTEAYLDEVADMGEQAETIFARATGDVVRDQVEAEILELVASPDRRTTRRSAQKQ